MAKKYSSIIYYTPAIVWGILIIYFSLMPGGNVPDLLKSIQGFFLHMAIYSLLAFLLAVGSTRLQRLKVSKQTILLTLLLILVLGIALELIQHNYIPNRVGEIEDVIANMLGGVAGILSWQFFTKP